MTRAAASDRAAAYVPRVLVETLVAHPDRPVPWGEWVEGTLVMADVSGFTALSERLAQAGKEGAEWLTEIIDRFFGRMLDIAWDCGGTTLTFGGDAILLLFYGEDHERRGVAASLRMLRGTRALPAYRVGNGRVKLAMSMGAHSGRFLTASVGTEEVAQYLILGPETVRTAQAEGRASSGELAITPELAERLGRHGVTEPLDAFLRMVRLVDTPRYPVSSDAESGADPASGTVPVPVSAHRLSAYLPPFVADALVCGSGGEVPERGYEHRNVTVAFVNVIGVDDILAAEGPDALVLELQRYMEPVVRLVESHQGYLVSNDIYTDGFKLIVAFGAPVAHEHDAENALRFSAELRDEIAGAGLRLTHRIGVNGGYVFAGDVGPAYRRQYTVMGDAVNLAARLMGAAEPGQVLVSAHTAEAAGPCFDIRGLAPIRVKGKAHPVEVGLLEREREREHVTAPAGFFGREAEMDVLDRARADVEGGVGRIVVVRGEAGMGKSRLTAEFERPLADRGWTVRLGGAYEHTAGQPLAPWVPVIGALVGLSADDGIETRSRKVLQAVERAGGPDLAEWAALLNPLLDLAIARSDQVRSLDSSDSRNRMFDLISELLRHASRSASLLVHLEDLHWADASSVGLLEHVARDIQSHRLLLLVTQRGDGGPDLDLPPANTTTIDLTELSRGSALDVLRDALGTELPAAALEVLMGKTRGNPLFMQEVARSIDRSGMVAAAPDERALARRMAEVEVPDSVQGLLMSSIDSLPPDDKEALRVASVLGTTFDIVTLRGAFAGRGDEAGLDTCLADLVRHALLVERGAGRARAYDFRHALVQEVAYGSLPFAARRHLHHAVAEYIEDTHSGALDTVCESLVHHYRLGGDAAKTAVFAVRAGGKARSLLAQEEAIDYYVIGAEAVRARTPGAALARSYLMEQIGDCYDQIGQHARAVRAYQDALSRLRTRGSDEARVAQGTLGLGERPSLHARESLLCYKVAVSYTRTHRDYVRALAWLDRATRALPRCEALLGARIERTRGVALLWMGAHEDAVRCARRALEVGRRHGDRVLEAHAATTLAGACVERGDVRMSMRYDTLALEAYREVSDLRGQAEAHANLVADHTCHGSLGLALEHSREALAIYRRTGDLTATAITHCNVAEILVMQGKCDEAIEHLETALELCERAGGGGTTVAGFALLNFARALAGKGLLPEAEARLEESVALLQKAGATTFLAEARIQRADLLLAEGRVAQALAQCERGLEESRALEMRLVETRALRLRGRIASATGDTETAAVLLQESADLAGHASAPYERGLALLELAELRAASGRSYRRTLGSAASLLAPCGSPGDAARVARLLAAGAPRLARAG